MESSPQFSKGILDYVAQQEQEHVETNKKEISRIVENFDDDLMLSSWGYTKPLKLTRGQDVTYLTLKIKSVGVSEVQDRISKGRPRPPSKMVTHKAGSPEAQALGQKQAVIVRQYDEADETYQEKLAEYDQNFGVLIMLTGLAYDIKDETGKIVLRGSNLDEPSEILDKEAALKWLRRKGITGSHYAQIVKDIRLLTEDVKEGEDLE